MSELTKEFEKYFPLPLKYNEIHERITDGNRLPLLIMDFMGMSEEQAENHSVLGTYLVQCANLMPEAVTLFGIVEEVLTLCATRTFDAETKHLLSHTAETIQTFKKKMEGGANNA